MLTQAQRDKSRHRSDVRKANERKFIDKAFGLLAEEAFVEWLKQHPNPYPPLERSDDDEDGLPGWDMLFRYVDWAFSRNVHRKQLNAARAVFKAHLAMTIELRTK